VNDPSPAGTQQGEHELRHGDGLRDTALLRQTDRVVMRHNFGQAVERW
jgi:hypothetical protein